MGKKEEHKCSCGETNPNKFYVKRKTKCKKCILNNAKIKYTNLNESDREKYIKKQNKWQDDNFLNFRLLQAKSRAKSKKLPFEIDVEYLEELLEQQENKCFYSGIEMGIGRLAKYSASIDRIDSTKGYVKGNVAFVIAAVNTMKSDLSEKEFLSIVKAIYKKQKS